MTAYKTKTLTSNAHFNKLVFALAFALFSSMVSAHDLRTAAPEDARVYFIGLADGDTVSSPLVVRFGLNGMGVAPAGVKQEHTGHHHLLLNLKTLPSLGAPLPSSENVIHFGKGQTETTIELPKGEHSLQLLLGNHFHVPHNPPVMSDKITIVVE